MRRHLALRIGLVVVVVLGSIWYLYPPKKTINLGLDLQGGIHLVLGVETDKALASQTDRVAEDLKGALEKKGIGVTKVVREGNTAIVVQLASPQNWNDALTVAAEFPNFERRNADQGAGRFTLVMADKEASRLRDLAVRQGVETIRNRVDQFGVAEPTITRQGEDRILIQLPGLQDPERAKALIGKTAHLEFRLLDERTSVEDALAGRLPETSEILYQRRIDKETKAERKIPYVVQKRTLLTGAELSRAEVQADPNSPGNWQVSIEFNAVGARIFGEVTEQNVGKHLAIILDGTVYSAPRINERIPGGRAVITGTFTIEEARDLAIVLRAGALPAPVTVLEERTVGPSLGADSIRQGLIAITASAVAVFLFMLFYYRLSGLIADVALGLNLLILVASMAAFGATLTLPGLAGIALTIGMAVDTNILIFERIREELRVGKSPRAAIEAGFSRAFRTIIDTHVTVLVTAAILYTFGTGAVKGFAVSLYVGLVGSLFTAVFFTRLLFDLIYGGRRRLGEISIRSRCSTTPTTTSSASASGPIWSPSSSS
jgi:preprotein translocase subunit SecD